MGKVLQEKINELFEATKDLKSLDEIKPHCLSFNEWVNQQSYSEKSLGTLFSRYGLYSKFRNIPLEQGKNAELIPKLKEDGSVKSHELKHYVTLLCGLDNKQWGDRNQSTRAIDRSPRYLRRKSQHRSESVMLTTKKSESYKISGSFPISKVLLVA